MRDSLVLLLLIAFIASCGEQASSPPPSPDRVGITQQQLQSELGEPDRTQVWTKDSEAIFGPPEAYWDDLTIGDRVEIWSYDQPDGVREFHFLRESDIVGHESLTPHGVVYEAV